MKMRIVIRIVCKNYVKLKKNQRFFLPVIGVLSNLLYLVMWKSIEDLTALKRNHFFVTSVPSYSFKAVPFNTHKNLMVEGSICEMSAYEV